MNDTQDDCRMAFEAWADTCADGRGWDLSENADGSYECEGVQDSWLAFQAAWSTRPSVAGDVLEALASIEKANTLISDLCEGRRSWVMSIPARIDYDPDLVISDALRRSKAAIAAMHPVIQPNVDELVREIVADEFWVEESAKHYAVIEVNSVIAIIRKWANGGK